VSTSRLRDDKASNEVVRLDLKPKMPDRKVQRVELDPAQYDDLARASGRVAKVIADALVSSPGYEALPDFAKAKALHAAIEKGHEAGRAELLQLHPDLAAKLTQTKVQAITAAPVRELPPALQGVR
jgi:hypothetical protein